MHCALFTIARNSHKDYTRWSFKRAATALTIIRGNFLSYLLLCRIFCSAFSPNHSFRGVDRRILSSVKLHKYLLKILVAMLRVFEFVCSPLWLVFVSDFSRNEKKNLSDCTHWWIVWCEFHLPFHSHRVSLIFYSEIVCPTNVSAFFM